MKIAFWFEFASTYSYLSAMRIAALAQERGIQVQWRSFLLGPIFAQHGWNDTPFNLYPSKGRYMWRDVERLCAAQCLPFQKPSVFPRSSLIAARIACHYADAAWLPRFVQSVYSANFAYDADISSSAVVAQCLRNCELEPEPILQTAQLPEAKEQLRAQSTQAAALGIFGAPSFVVDKELFWGNDRLIAALDWCEAASNKKNNPLVRSSKQ